MTETERPKRRQRQKGKRKGDGESSDEARLSDPSDAKGEEEAR